MPVATTDRRRRTIAAIHVLAAQLGMDTADGNPSSEYRSMLWTIARARSCNELDFTALERVRAHLAALVRARGLDAPRASRRPPDSKWGWVNRAAPDRRAMLWKIRALLRAAGRERAYADRIAHNMFGIERLELCGPRELHAIVAALAKDRARKEARA